MSGLRGRGTQEWPVAPMKAMTARACRSATGGGTSRSGTGTVSLVRRAGGAFDAVSSTGKPKLPQWPWLATAVRAATDHDVVLDGEVIAYDDEGRHTFQSVGRADRDHAFVVFDLFALDGDGPSRPSVARAAGVVGGDRATDVSADDHPGE